jgi:enolase
MNKNKQSLHSTHVIANHILVSFHVAFMSSLLNIPADLYGPDVLKFVFTSYETIISALFLLISFHTGVAIHEMGHYLRAVKSNALKENILPEAKRNAGRNFFGRLMWYTGMFLQIPYGKFAGVKKEGLTYYPEAPFNLSVAAAGPAISGKMALVMLPLAIILLIIGLTLHHDLMTYIGRLCLGIGAVGLLDFLLADPGKLKEYSRREKLAAQHAKRVEIPGEHWIERAKAVKEMLRNKRMQEITFEKGEKLRAPWQFRNCGMGGRHTEQEYPESNISMQEMMFMPLCAKNYEEAQMITVRLQTRLKQIIEKATGSRVMGTGLEGGLAPYISKEPSDTIPEQRMWRMAVQTIKDIGYVPGKDIVLAFDPALSELSNAYRIEFKQSDSIGMYFFWRSEEKIVMSRDQLVDLYKKTVEEIPIISLEDAFAEDDYEGWRLLMKELGDKVLIIGDDLNTALIKANQIGTLSETILAMLVALGKGLELVVSHRSKSPNDDMEAQIALAANALGMKTGGGANTERLFKYGAVTKIMKDMEKVIEGKYEKKGLFETKKFIDSLVITDVIAYEEPTNAGIPTVGVEVHLGIEGSEKYRRILKFTGATPLGTSAGLDEAIHLVDSIIERSPVVDKHRDLFSEQGDKTYKFKKELTTNDITQTEDQELFALWNMSQRYGGMGCKNAVKNVLNIIAKEFISKKAVDFTSIIELDRKLLTIEKETAIKRGKVSQNATSDEFIKIMQRKGNLGMNAILSMSLAVGRLIAHIQGKDLWQLLREEMKQTVARAILAHGGLDLISDGLTKEKLQQLQGSKDMSWRLFCDNLTFDDLIMGLQKVEEKVKKDDIKLYQVLREQMQIYTDRK